MHGLIIEGQIFYIEKHYSEATLQKVFKIAQVRNPIFSTHERYSDKLIPNLLAALAQVTGEDQQQLTAMSGKYFVHFLKKYHYDKLLRIIGRTFSDLLKGLDNLHEFFRLSYPRIKPPSFAIEKEGTEGVILHYRSRRHGFIAYVMGILNELADLFYNIDLGITVLRREEKGNFMYAVLQLEYHNENFVSEKKYIKDYKTTNLEMPLQATAFLEMFPFYIAFNRHLEICLTGSGLVHAFNETNYFLNKKIDSEFALIRPFVKFTWDAVRSHSLCIFKIESIRVVKKSDLQRDTTITFKVNEELQDKVDVHDAALPNYEAPTSKPKIEAEEDDSGIPLLLKGQMVYVKQADIVLFLASLQVNSLDELYDTGVRINDYSISDCNRDMMMATVQKSDDMKTLLRSEKEKSRQLGRNLNTIAGARKVSRSLLRKIMPKDVADKVASHSALEKLIVSEAFPNISVAYIMLCDFESVTAKMTNQQIVILINRLCQKWDGICEKHGVHPIESIGEYYAMCCGVLKQTREHAEYLCDAVLAIMYSMRGFIDAVTDIPISIRAGIHSGPAVAGVVGIKSPRYRLYGEAPNIAVKMLNSGKEPHIIVTNELVKDELENYTPEMFEFETHGDFKLRGKGRLSTYRLVDKKSAPRSELNPLLTEEDTIGENPADGGSDSDDMEECYTPVEDLASECGSAMSELRTSGMSAGYNIGSSMSSNKSEAASRMSGAGGSRASQASRTSAASKLLRQSDKENLTAEEAAKLATDINKAMGSLKKLKVQV